MKSTGAQSSNEWRRLDDITGYQANSSSNGCQVIYPIARKNTDDKIKLIATCKDCGISSVLLMEISKSYTQPTRAGVSTRFAIMSTSTVKCVITNMSTWFLHEYKYEYKSWT